MCGHSTTHKLAPAHPDLALGLALLAVPFLSSGPAHAHRPAETLGVIRVLSRRYAPIVADAEAGFGGPLNCYELMKQMIEAGAAGVHFEDQLSSEKKCGHLGGKVGALARCHRQSCC